MYDLKFKDPFVMIKKIFLIIFVSFFLLVGGAFIFLQTKSDFILEKVGQLVEDATGAPLNMQALPSLAFFPTPSVSLGQASWRSPDLSVNFKSARVLFSFTELLQGNFALAEVSFDGLNLVFDATAITTEIENNRAESDKNTKASTSTSFSSFSTIIEDAFKFIPENITLKNSTVNYKDETQNLVILNLNTEINNFSLNAKTSMTFKSIVQYINASTEQDFELSCDSDLDFVLTTNTVSFDLSSLELLPKQGLGFTESVLAEGKIDLNFQPFDVLKVEATLKSPFAQAQITQKGELSKDGLIADITGTLYPRLIVQTFSPDLSLPKTPDIDTVTLTTEMSYKEEILSFQNFVSTLGKSTIKTSLIYNQNANSISGDLSLSSFVLDNFFINTEDSTQKISENTLSSNNSSSQVVSTSTKIELPTVLQKTNFDIAIKLDEIRYDTLTLQSLSTKLQGTNSLLSLNELALKFLETDISGQMTADLGIAQNMHVTFDIPNLDINTWNKTFTGSTGLAGIAKINTKLSFPFSDPMSNLNGSGQVDLTNLKIESKLLPTVTKILVASKVTDHYFEFADGKIPFSLAKSVLTLNKAYLNSDKYYITASGTANLLSEAINMNVEAGKGQNSTLIIPVSIKGTMSDPKVTISLKDSANIVTHIFDSTLKIDASSLNEKIDEKLTEGINSGLNKLFGK